MPLKTYSVHCLGGVLVHGLDLNQSTRYLYVFPSLLCHVMFLFVIHDYTTIATKDKEKSTQK